MKNLTIVVLYVFFISMTLGCDVTTKYEGKPFSMDKLKENTLYVVRSEEELSKYFDIEEMPKIDFSENSLLLAKGYVTKKLSKITNIYSTINNKNDHRIKIDIELSDDAMIDEWQLIRLVPVISYEAGAKLWITITPTGTIVEKNNSNELDITDYITSLENGDVIDDISSNIKENTPYVIRSAEEFSKYFNIEEMPKIDFLKNSLLLVKGRAYAGIYEITRKFSYEDNGDYILNVNIFHHLIATSNMPAWYIATLTPVLDDSAKIELNILTIESNVFSQ